MKIHRFFVKQNLGVGLVEVSDAVVVRQIQNVLKLNNGEAVILFNTTGTEAVGIIETVEKKKVMVSVEKVTNHSLPEKTVNLYCAILKSENFDLVVQKCTEVGIVKIVPIITNRTIKKNINLERLRRIAIEATEQSGRVYVPEIVAPVALREALLETAKNATNIFFDFDGEPLENYRNDAKEINLFIGPEGGWTDEEKKVAAECGANIALLGKTILRGETAAIVASYLANNS